MFTGLQNLSFSFSGVLLSGLTSLACTFMSSATQTLELACTFLLLTEKIKDIKQSSVVATLFWCQG
jgi:hypothetical protein